MRDDPGPLPAAVIQQPRISRETSRKIRALCFILSVTVIFNHAITYDHVWDWQGYRVEPLAPGYFAQVPYEVAIQQFLSGALGRITNPFFFMVSGFLFFYAWKPDLDSWKRKLKRRALTLLAPFIIWTLIGKGLNFLNFMAGKWSSVFDGSSQYGAADLAVTFWNMHPPTQLWFLRDLMLIMLFGAPIILLLVKLPARAFFPLILLAYMLPWNAYVEKNCLCFFTAGAFLGYRQFDPTLQQNRARLRWIVLWIVLGIAYTTLAIVTDWNLRVLFKSMVIAGIGGAWALYDFFGSVLRNAFDRVSGHRFFVYMGFDPLLPIIEIPLLAALPGTQAMRIAVFLLLPIVVTAICVLAASLLSRCSPKSYYVVTGGRLPGQKEE